MAEVSFLVALVLAGSALLSLFLILLFLMVVYLRGGKDDLTAAAKALREVRDVGMGASIRHAIEAWKSVDKPKI